MLILNIKNDDSWSPKNMDVVCPRKNDYYFHSHSMKKMTDVDRKGCLNTLWILRC